MNKRQTYEQANKVFDKAVKLEQDFGEFFTGLFSALWFFDLKKLGSGTFKSCVCLCLQLLYRVTR